MNNLKQKYLSIIGLFLVALIWGSTFSANKYVLNAFSPLYLMSIRFLIAFFLMMLIFRKKFKGLKFKNLQGGILAGLALFIAFVLQTYGLVYTTAGKQAFLSGAYVVMVPFMTGIVFKKKPSMKAYIGAAICFYGISLISLNENLSVGLGDGLTLISSILFAAQIVIAAYYVQKEAPAVIATVQFGVMGLLSLLSALAVEPIPAALTSGKELLLIIYLGLVGSAAAYYLQIVCQKYTSPTATSIILSLEAVFGSILAVIFLGDILTVKIILGSAAILLAIWISES